MLKTSSNYSISPLCLSRGFTLVEMLVAVALVLLMMTMFAQVFVMSTESLSQQRGIAENDQRGRLLTMTIRGDLDERTFRDLLPFRANEDTRQLGHSLARRSGYFEIDEGNPSDPTDDVLSFTASVNIRLQGKDASPFVGNAAALSQTIVTGLIASDTISVGGGVAQYITKGSEICISQSDYNNGSYVVTGFPSATTISVSPAVLSLQSNVINTSSTFGFLSISASEPEADDGVFGNGKAASALAEICYFLRNGILYRRILLIRETPAGTTPQPVWSTGQPILWNNGVGPNVWNGIANTESYFPTATTTTFWRDFDYSAFFYPGNGFGLAPGVRFHSATESLSNSNQPAQSLINTAQIIADPSMATPAFPFSLGIPHWRFGHSTTNGLPQDASTTAFYNGGVVSIGRFNLQECANTAFGYPGNVNNSNPFDSQNVVIDTSTGLVAALEGQTNRRGEDILLTNVLSFDIKVWDALGGQFVDVGGNSVVTLAGTQVPGPLSAGAGIWTDNATSTGNIVGGRLNSTYGPGITNNPAVRNSVLNHYRFDTWHPNASITATATSPATGTSFYNEPPYYQPPPYYTNNTPPPPPYTYNEPPYVPVALNPATGLLQSAPLSALQITINYRDISSNQIRQVTIVQSLVDRVKQTSMTNEAPEE